MTEVATPARRSDDAITADFERVWPAVSARLRRMLGARGLAREEAEDICQEVAWRVLSRDIHYASAADLYPWAATVARRLSIDTYRRDRHIAMVELPDRAEPHDVADIVEHRSRLRAVAAAMPALSEADRAALTQPAVPTTPLSRRDSVKLAVRRHRARGRLLALVEAAGVVVAWVLGRNSVPRSARMAGALAVAAAPAMMFALSYSPPGAGDPGGRVPRAAPPSPTVLVDVAGPSLVAPPVAPPPRQPASPPVSPAVATPRAAPAPPRPSAEVVANGPDGRTVAVARRRPAEPDEPVLCLSPVVVPEVCADL